MKSIAIICIGDELLDGRITDENARYLIAQAGHHETRVKEIRILGDHRQEIAAALDDVDDVDFVVISGGLGPTADDVTRDAAAEFSGDELVENQALVDQLRRRFKQRNFPFSDNNRRQCQFPSSATVLASEVGTAAGFLLRRQHSDYYFFPGVPTEFRWFAHRYLPGFDAKKQSPFAKKLLFFGRGESELESRLHEVAAQAQRDEVSIGYRAEFPVIEIMLKGPASASEAIEAGVRQEIGRWLIAEDDEAFSARVGRRLVEAEATVSVAESCTAGMVAAKLTEVSGSSRYFEQGYLTYSNESKLELLDVDPKSLKAHGAVSPQVVTQMAAGAKRRSGADYAIAVSGIAGPTGGSDTKPVGTVDIAIAGPQGVYYKRNHWPHRDRRQVRILSVYCALGLLLWRLEARLQEHRVDGPFSFESVRQGLPDLGG